MPKFNVTYEIVTPESAEHGDADERGFYLQNVSLSEAIDALEHCHVEADCCPVSSPRWFTAYNVSEDYITGGIESRSLHLPDSITESSRMRIARLIHCYGV